MIHFFKYGKFFFTLPYKVIIIISVIYFTSSFYMPKFEIFLLSHFQIRFVISFCRVFLLFAYVASLLSPMVPLSISHSNYVHHAIELVMSFSLSYLIFNSVLLTYGKEMEPSLIV